MSADFKEQLRKRKLNTEEELRQALAKASRNMGLKSSAKPLSRTDNEALREVLDALGYKDTMIPNDDFQTPFQVFTNVLETNGIMMRKVKLTGDWFKESVGPYLGYDKEGNLLALIPSYWGHTYTIVGPDGKRARLNRKVCNKILSEDAYTFTVPLPNGKIGIKDLTKYVFRVLPPSCNIHLLIISLAVVLLGMITPAVTKRLFDTVIPSGIIANIFPMAALLLGTAIGESLMSLSRELTIKRLNKFVKIPLQNAVMARTFSLKPNFFLKYSSGDLTNRLNSASRICEYISEAYLGVLLTSVFSLVYLVQVFIYAKALLPIAIALIAFQSLVSYFYYKITARVRMDYEQVKSALSGTEYNLFAGVQKIKLTGSEKRAYTRWLKEYSKSAGMVYNPTAWLSLLPALATFVSIAGTVVIYLLTIEKGIPMSNYIAFNSAFGSVIGMFMSLQGIIPSLALIRPNVQLLQPILENEPEMDTSSRKIESLSGAIEVKDLSFRYAEDSPIVLNKVNVSIKPGEYVGIVGESGCGKSTLLRLLLGFEKPTEGAIAYDSYDLQDVNKSSLRQHIGCCLQNGQLFTGDIFQNITITAPWSTQEDAWEALRLASLKEDVEAMPMGLHTIISGDGGGFSGGQKQRMLIARALIGKPSIVFFDEATSALDNISQKQVSDNMDSLHCTRVVIAHRLSTIRNCDRILVMSNGRIVEEGNFDQLMAKQGLFYELSKRQM